MSVLLEALKKAAAEKKALEQKNVESALRPVLSQRNQPKPASPSLSRPESSAFAVADDAPLALDFNFDLGDDLPIQSHQPNINQTPKSAEIAEPTDDAPPLPPTPEPTTPAAPASNSSLNLKMAQTPSDRPQTRSNLDLDALDDSFESLDSLMDALDEVAEPASADIAVTSSPLAAPVADAPSARAAQSSPPSSQATAKSSNTPLDKANPAPSALVDEAPPPSQPEKPQTTSAVDKADVVQMQHILNKATQAPATKKPRSRWLLWLLLLLLVVGLALAYGWLKTRDLWTASSTTIGRDAVVSASVLSSEEALNQQNEQAQVVESPLETQVNDGEQLLPDSPTQPLVEPPLPSADEADSTEGDKQSQPDPSVAQICDLPLQTAGGVISPRPSLETGASAPTKAAPPATVRRRPANAPTEANTVQVQPKVAPAFNQQAYQAYLAGDFAQARVLYEQGLAQQANNKTSLLGLAAVAAQDADWTMSIDYYRQILQHYPQDSDALQGIASIATALESSPQLKQDLEALNRQIPDSAVLQFALGNVYAQEGDWFKAQQAYFDSVRLDMNNADYRLNLAISFDRLGQYELALTHYRAAMALQTGDDARFDANAVAQRIQALAAFLGQGH
jgi:tetratricopeptide (TPR) repeat protein